MPPSGRPPGSRLSAIRLVVVESPDLAAPLVGALDAAGVGAWAWVELENTLYWSPRVPDLLGIDPRAPDLLGLFLGSVHPDDRPGVGALINRKLAGEFFLLRFRARDRDATYRWLEMRGRIQRDAAGVLVTQGGTVRDVTQEVEQQEERTEANARLEALINAMPFGVWAGSGDPLAITHENATTVAWWGPQVGKGVDDFPAEAARVWRAQIAEAVAGRIGRARTEFRKPTGLQVLDQITAPVTVAGEVTGVVGVCIDVTEEHRQRQFESLLTCIASDFVSQSSDALEAALTQALERLGRFLGAALAALGEVDDQGILRVTHWWIDPATGRDRPALVELDLSTTGGLLQILHANEPLIVRELAELPPDTIPRGWLEARRLRSFAIVPARLSDGGLMVMGVAAGPDQTINWPPDTIPLLRLTSAILSGVMARRRAESQQRIVERRMQDAQKLESLGVLAGGIAHDFNNLLTAILGNASLLRGELPNQPELAGPLEQIELASRRAADLCRQMLAYAGRGRFALQPLEINEVVRASEPLLRVSVPKKALLEFDLAQGLSPVVADHAQLRQVVVNLIHNAAEAIGGTEGTITVATSEITCTARELAGTVYSPQLEAGRYVRLSVTDNGAGMTPETAARIFDPFFTTKFTGRGLGLAAVVGIVRAHKGALRVETAPGAGSRFELLLPAQLRAGTEAQTGPPLPDDAALSNWRTTGTALVVDDEPGVRELVKSVLHRAGMQVVVAENGRTAVESFRERAGEITLVVADLTMPGLDGRETLAAMRGIKPDLTAILMSGYAQNQIADVTGSLFLQKPFTPLALRQAMWKALGGT